MMTNFSGRIKSCKAVKKHYKGGRDETRKENIEILEMS